MAKQTNTSEPYLLIIWDMGDDSFYPFVAFGRSEEEAKQRGWQAWLDEHQLPGEDREDHYSEDGGKAGYVPVLALNRADIELFLSTAEH